MTPKEKAVDLWVFFYERQPEDYSDFFCKKEAKVLAQKVVDEIMEVIDDNCLEYDDNYWQQVKTEIEKL